MPRVPEGVPVSLAPDERAPEPEYRPPAPSLRVVTDDDRDLYGVLNLRGRDAFDLPERALSAFDKRAADIEIELTNEAQRAAFRRLASTRRFEINRRIQQHVAGEIRRYDDQTTDSYVANEVDAAIASGDVARVQLGVARAGAALTDYANRNGLPPEWLESKRLDASTKVHSGVVERFLANGQDLAAQEYYQANRAAIAGSRQAHLEKALEVGTTRGESQRRADAILLQHRDLGGAIAEARKIDVPALRDATEARVRDYFTVAKAAEEERQRAASAKAWDIFAKSKSLDTVPPAVFAAMDGKSRLALENEARGIHTATDPNVYYELRTMAAREPEKFQRLDLRQYFDKLDQGDREKFIEMQQPDKLKEAATLDQQLSDMHEQLGWDSSDKKKKGLFDRRVIEAINAEQKLKGKTLTLEERQAVMDRMVLRGRAKGSGWLWDSSGRLYEFAGTDQARNFEPEIPDEDRKQIVARFTARKGRRPNEQEIMSTFKTWRGLQ